ncbi:MarC family protein [Bradyrhizobium sp. B117]|uniref:MarC family protein n=1 Tax=Bradyrhizobium sp. B117 TaxID=3140246 RepID=UPI0031838AE9
MPVEIACVLVLPSGMFICLPDVQARAGQQASFCPAGMAGCDWRGLREDRAKALEQAPWLQTSSWRVFSYEFPAFCQATETAAGRNPNKRLELPGSHEISEHDSCSAGQSKGTRKTVAWNQFVGTIMLLYALTNPVGAIPVFLPMTGRAGVVKTHRIIVLACAAVAVFFIGSAMFEKEILAFFNVGLDDFRIAGGLLVLVIAFEMFQAQYGKFIHGLAITPFAFPLLVGPAELSIMITLSNDNPGWLGKAFLAAAAVLATSLIGLTLWMAAAIERFLGRTGINIMTRVMALIIAAIAVNFIMRGIKSQLPGMVSR